MEKSILFSYNKKGVDNMSFSTNIKNEISNKISNVNDLKSLCIQKQNL